MQKRKKLRIFLLTLVYISCISIFIVSAIGLVFWAKGYRFDFKNKKITQIGMIFVKTYPQDTKIFINNEFYDQIPASLRINNLLPGIYNVRIEKEGYNSFEKNIEVQPEKVCQLDYVVLWPKNLEKIKIAENASQFKLSNSEKEIAFLDSEKKNLKILNLSSGEQPQIFSSPTPIAEFFFSKNSDFLVIKQEPNIFKFINIKNPSELFEAQNFSRLIPTDSNQDFLGTIGNNLYKLNLFDIKNPLLIEENVLNFASLDNKIFYTKLKNNIFWLIQKDLSGQNRQEIADFTSSPTIFLPHNRKEITILLASGDLYLWKDKKTYDKIGSNIKNVVWSKNDKKFIYNSDNEIWTYYLDNTDGLPENDIFFRLSDGLSEILWYFDYYHVIFTTEKSLSIADFDGKNVYDLASELSPIEKKDPHLDQSGQARFLTSEEQNSLFYKDKGSLYQIKLPFK